MRTIAALTLGISIFGISFASVADVTMPTVTRVTFLTGGKPIAGKVTFSVSCFGWPCHPGENNCSGEGAPEGAPALAEVFKFSASCEKAPCEINEPYYLNYRKLDHCDIQGVADGRPFTLKNYSKQPVDFQKCQTDQGGNRRCELTVAIPE